VVVGEETGVADDAVVETRGELVPESAGEGALHGVVIDEVLLEGGEEVGGGGG
jgi:hypothetical protein